MARCPEPARSIALLAATALVVAAASWATPVAASHGADAGEATRTPTTAEHTPHEDDAGPLGSEWLPFALLVVVLILLAVVVLVVAAIRRFLGSR